jgi:hypothetical protein
MKDIKTILLSKNAPGQTSAGRSGMAYRMGCYATIFEDDDGWFGYCYHGVGYGGNAFESEDLTGFASVKDAEADARACYQPMPGD